MRLHWSGSEVLHLDSITNGENVGIAGAHVLVNADASTFADLEPGCLGQRRVRPHAERKDHDVGWILLAGLRLHLERAALQLSESGYAIVERQVHAVAFQVPFDQVGHLPVEWARAPDRASRRGSRRSRHGPGSPPFPDR